MLKRISAAITLRSRSSGNISSSSSASLDEVYKKSEIIHSSKKPTFLQKNSFVIPVDSTLINHEKAEEPDISIDPFDSLNTLKRSKSLQFLPSRKLSLNNLRRKTPKAVHFEEESQSANPSCENMLPGDTKTDTDFSTLGFMSSPRHPIENQENGCEKTGLSSTDYKMQQDFPLTDLFEEEHLPPKDEIMVREVALIDSEAQDLSYESASARESEEGSSITGSSNSSNKSFFNFEFAPNEEISLLISQIRKEFDFKDESVDFDLQSTLEAFLEFSIDQKYKLNQTEAEYELLKKEVQKLEEATEQKKYLYSENIQLKKKIQGYETEVATLESAADELASQLSALNSTNENLFKERHKLEEEIAARTSEYNEVLRLLQDTYESIRTRGVSLGESTNLAQAVALELDQKRQVEDMLFQTTQESKRYKEQQEAAKSMIDSLRNKLEDVELSKSEMQENLERQIKELQVKKVQELEATGYKIHSIEEKTKLIQNEKVQLQEKLQSLQELWAAALSNEKDLSARIRAIAEENEVLHSEIQKNKQEFKELDNGIGEISKSMAALMSDKDSTIHKLTGEVSNMKRTIHFLEEKHREKRIEKLEQSQFLETIAGELSRVNRVLQVLDSSTRDIKITAQTILAASHEEIDQIRQMATKMEQSDLSRVDAVKESEIHKTSNKLLVEFVRNIIEKLCCALNPMLLEESITYMKNRYQVFKATTIFDNNHQMIFAETTHFFSKAVQHLVEQYIENETYLNKELRARNRNYTHIMDSIYNGMLNTKSEDERGGSKPENKS